MKAFTERNPLLIGAVAITVVVALVLGVLVLNKSVFTPSYTVHADFADTAGIGKSAKVTVAGVQVGTVSAVHLAGNHVVVDLAINHGVVLPQRTSAAIQVQTVLGVLDVALHPLSGWRHPLRAGATITDTTVPVEFQNVQNVGGNLLQKSDVRAFNQLLTSIEKISRGKQAQVATIINGLDKFTGVVDQRSREVSQLIDAANTLASTVAQRDQQLAGVIDNLSLVVQGLAAHSSQLTRLIQQTDNFATQTASLVGQNQPKLQALLANLHSVLAVVAKHQEDLAQGVSYLAAAVKGFASVGYSGPNNAPNTWANIYTNLVGTAGGYGVLGPCGALDQALNVVFGPDPLPCDQQTGPLPGTAAQPSGSTSPTQANPAGGRSGSTSSAGATPGSTPDTTTSTPNSVQQLLGGLLGG